MSQAPFTDYYRILQVHYEASREVITAAYKKLCHIYHPDKGINNATRIQLINEAYEVLRDDTSRAQYHKIWLAHSFPNISTQLPDGEAVEFRYAFSDDNTDAYSVMDDFFLALQSNENIEAYLRLTYRDKSRISSEQFIEWRKAVNACFSLKSYDIKPLNAINNCIIDEVSYPKAQCFSVTTTEINKHTLETQSETVTKYAAFDGACWRVCLLLPDIAASTLKFRLLSEKTGSFDPLSLYHNAVSRIHIQTGLASKEAFFEIAELEALRSLRYHMPLSFIAFKVIPDSALRLPYSGSHFAEILKKTLRKTDFCCCLSDDTFVCLLTGTRRSGADGAIKKVLSHITGVDYMVKYASDAYLSQQNIEIFINGLTNKLIK